MSSSWPAKDPQEILDYDIIWTDRLDTDDTIVTSTWVVDPSDDALVIDSDENDNTTTKVWLSGGTLGSTYFVTNTIVTAGGRTHELTVKLKIKEK